MYTKQSKLVEVFETNDGLRLEYKKSSDGYTVFINNKIIADGETKKLATLNTIFALARG